MDDEQDGATAAFPVTRRGPADRRTPGVMIATRTPERSSGGALTKEESDYSYKEDTDRAGVPAP